MPINLESLSAMQDNTKVFLNNDGTFQKASFFSKKETINQNKQNIVNTLKQTIASDPKYFGVQKHLEGMIDGLMTSKLSAKGITAGQIKDILAYADSLSTPRAFPVNLANFLCRGKTFEKVSSPAPLYKTF